MVGRRRGGEVYCHSCIPVRRNPRRFCTSCGATGVRIVRTTNGAVCAACDINAFTHCARCDATTTIAKRINRTPVCAPCLRFLRTTPRECPSCREMHLLPYLHNGRDVCPRCAGLTSIFSCSDCGSDAVPLPGDTCLDCRYTQWRSTIARLLEDETAPVPTRLIGLLAVMFGLPITTSTGVRRDQLLVGENTVRLLLSQDPLNLPPQIAELMRRHLLEVNRRHPTSEWAFPGRHRGRHLEPLGVTRRLRRMGIRTAAAQTAAALQLARDIPAPVLADLLGWSVERAEDWASAAAHDWTTYPELRSPSRKVITLGTVRKTVDLGLA